MNAMAEQLTAIRSRVRQHHTLMAGEMLDTLIAEVERDAELQRTVNTPATRRRNGRKPDCRFGWKYGKGGAVRNRRHACGAECSWSNVQALEWLARTPYPGSTAPPRLVAVPPCANCDRSRSDHWEPAADPDTGRLTGYRAIKECEYQPVEAAA